MQIEVEVFNPVYACDVERVFDHEHPGFFDCIVDLPPSAVGVDDLALLDAIEEAIRNDLGICLADGEISYSIVESINRSADDELY